jgi:hypothetical protein
VARLYANENFPLPVVEALRRLGHDVVTVREAGRAEQAITDRRFWRRPAATGGPS